MSTERMLVKALQEQPTLLMPLLLALYFVARILTRAVQVLSSKTSRQTRFTSWY